MPRARIAVTDERLTDDWRTRAACLGLAELFWGAESHPARIQQAIRICACCPVIDECRSYADATHAVGVWAGELRWSTTSKRVR